MERGFTGNKTQLIENEKQKFLNNTKEVTVEMIYKQCELLQKYRADNDRYNSDRAISILDAMCEIAAKEGVG